MTIQQRNNWQNIRLGELITLEYGKSLPEKDRRDGPYHVVGSSGVVGVHNQASSKGPGIVVGRKGSIGDVSWIERDFWPIDTTYFVRLRGDDIDLKWLFYELTALNLGKRFHQSDVVPGLNREIVHKMKISLPSLPEQRKIAETLSTVDDSIQKAGEAIGHTERLKKGLLRELIVDRAITQDWEEIELGSIAKIITGKTPSTFQPSFWNGQIPFFTPVDFYETKFIAETERYVTKDGASEVGELLPEKTVLVVCIGSIGNVALVGKPGISNQQINALICNKDVVPEFVYYSLVAKTSQLKSTAGIAVVPIIKKSLFSRFRIGLPESPIQMRIAAILSEVDHKFDLERKRRRSLQLIKESLLNDLITGKVRHPEFM